MLFKSTKIQKNYNETPFGEIKRYPTHDYTCQFNSIYYLCAEFL